MKLSQQIINDIANTCASTQVEDDHHLLLQKLKQINSEFKFTEVLTRGGWYRTAGVIDPQLHHVTNSLTDWLESEFDSDVDQLIEKYAHAGYIVTQFVGKTHYFIAQIGKQAHEFIQLEVEELQEVADHLLINEEHFPDDIEEVIEPSDPVKVSADKIEQPRYVFRQITSVSEYIQQMAEVSAEKGKDDDLAIVRFMKDWDRSSSKEQKPFSEHWVLMLREYTDPYGEPVKQAKPISTYSKPLSLMEMNPNVTGSKLASLIHGFDRDIGYPMAWYFFMLSHTEVPHTLAEAIHKDQVGAYDYLPAKDMQVLKDWVTSPYGV